MTCEGFDLGYPLPQKSMKGTQIEGRQYKSSTFSTSKFSGRQRGSAEARFSPASRFSSQLDPL
jgi:hypothetical protein